MSFVNEWQHIIRCCTQNVVSLKNIVQIVNFNSTFVICLRLVFIEMLNKFITYLVCWYNTLYEVSPVA